MNDLDFKIKKIISKKEAIWNFIIPNLQDNVCINNNCGCDGNCKCKENKDNGT